MSKGLLFINFFYPGYIGLKEGSVYLLYVDGNPASVQVYKHLRPVEILDFSNNIDILYKSDKRVILHLRNVIDSLGDPLACIQPLEKKDAIALSSEDVRIVFDTSRHYHKVFKPRPFTELIIGYEIESTTSVMEGVRSFSKKVLAEFF